MTKCGAKTRQGTPCQRAPMKNGRCYLHGGKTPSGIESPHFKHGRYSKYLPERLVQLWEQVEADAEIDILARNIKIREMFIRDHLQILDDAPSSAEIWATVQKYVVDAVAGYKASDDAKVYKALYELEAIADSQTAYYSAVGEITNHMAEQRKDHTAISNIQYKGENAITVKELMTFMGAVLSIINTVVTDKSQRVEIKNQVDNLFNRPVEILE